ncbi:MAG: hypothetical protein D6677_03145 [Calditrichaeota bacterium]|nr:MAG: hypothetical protein D6677_03145 [Calditrichota bacterium]
MAARCLIVSYLFPPVGGGGVQRITKFVKYLHRLGWEITVLTSAEPVHLPVDPTLLEEVPSDVRVIRFADRQTHRLAQLRARIVPGFIQRWIGAFVFLPDSLKSWSARVAGQIEELCRREQFDIVMITSPPYSLAETAAHLAQKASLPVVLDMRDPWTINPFKIYPTPWHKKRDKVLEYKALSGVKHGVSVSAELIQYLQTLGLDTNNWRFIPNGYDEDDFTDLQPHSPEEGFFHLAFSGTFYSHINNPMLLFNVLAAFKKNFPESYKRIRFHHVGQSVPDLGQLAEKAGCADVVNIHGYKSHREALAFLSWMHALVMILDPAHPRSVNTIGGKVYEYLRLCKPIVALIPEKGEAARLLKKYGHPVILDPARPEAAARRLHGIITGTEKITPGTHGNIKELSREAQARQLDRFFRSIIAQKK